MTRRDKRTDISDIQTSEEDTRATTSKREIDGAQEHALLVRFDRRTLTVLGVLLLLFFAATALKLNGSSIGVWNSILPDEGEQSNILMGTPRSIRSDEWLAMTPAILSQARSGFPVVNVGWGNGSAPLMASLPVRHWAMVIRPQFWGFFVLDLERGFAFYWDIKGLFLFSGMFILLMLLTRNHLGVSLLGATWVFFSGFTQWWYASAMLMETGCFAFLIVAAHYIALSGSRRAIAVASFVFAICSLNLGLTLYPPFQIPLFYLGVAILAGSLGPQIAAGGSKKDLGFRATSLTLALAGIAVFLVLYHRDAKDAVDLMRGTVYPGARLVDGGDMTIAKLFNGFFGFFMTQDSVPKVWGNICEASNYVLFFPVVFGALLWGICRRRSASAIEWALSLYLSVVAVWALTGFPHWLAVGSAFAMSPPSRSLIGLGLGSIILCCVFLAKSRVDCPKPPVKQILVGLGLLALIIVYARIFNPATDNFATKRQVAIVCAVTAFAGYALLARRRIIFAALVLIPHVAAYSAVNPVMVGLGPIVHSAMLQDVSRIVAQDPEAGWTVYGSWIMANAFKTTGARVFNGTKITPQLSEFRVLDPSAANVSVYNRMAYVDLQPASGATVTFTLAQGDLFSVNIDPANELWHQLGVRYVALPFKSSEPKFLAKTEMALEFPASQIWIYRYRW